MKFIKLTKGMVSKVCDCHYDLVSKYHWNYHPNGYAISAYYGKDGKHHVLRMHRIINNTPAGLDTDHINRDKLDNQCTNLRTATRSENNRNSKLRIDNTSGIKGITWDKANMKWMAQYVDKGRNKKIGRFPTKLEAKEALDAYCSNLA